MEPETILNSTSILGLTLWLVRLSLTAGSAKDVVSATSGTGIGNSLVLFPPHTGGVAEAQEQTGLGRSGGTHSKETQEQEDKTGRVTFSPIQTRVGSPLIPFTHVVVCASVSDTIITHNPCTHTRTGEAEGSEEEERGGEGGEKDEDGADHQ